MNGSDSRTNGAPADERRGTGGGGGGSALGGAAGGAPRGALGGRFPAEPGTLRGFLTAGCAARCLAGRRAGGFRPGYPHRPFS